MIRGGSYQVASELTMNIWLFDNTGRTRVGVTSSSAAVIKRVKVLDLLINARDLFVDDAAGTR